MTNEKICDLCGVSYDSSFNHVFVREYDTDNDEIIEYNYCSIDCLKVGWQDE